MLRSNELLTYSDLMNLAYVVEMARKGAKVAWTGVGDEPRYGVARSVGDEKGNFLRSNEDVRDAYLRITTKTGWDVFLPVEELAALHAKSEFMEYNW